MTAVSIHLASALLFFITEFNLPLYLHSLLHVPFKSTYASFFSLPHDVNEVNEFLAVHPAPCNNNKISGLKKQNLLLLGVHFCNMKIQ